MKVCGLGDLNSGDIGLIEAGSVGRALVIGATGPENVRYAVIITAEPFDHQGRPSNMLLLDDEHFEYWPNALVMDDGKIDVDPSSAYHNFEEQRFSILPSDDGGSYLYAVNSTIYGQRIRIDLSNGDFIKITPKSSYWGFYRWVFSVPDPLRPGERIPLFNFNAAPKTA